MSELEDMINGVLSDPEQMEKISRIAQSLMGGEGSSPPAAPDTAMLGRISELMNGGSDSKQALFEAMKPYLSEKRRGKMDKAMKLARLARIARLAMGETGGDDV